MTQDDHKRAAAHAALEFVESGSILGVGSGSTVHHFIEALAGVRRRIAGAVASSRETERRLRERGLPVVELTCVDAVALYVDGADEATRDRRLVKGGGGALTREKIVAAASERFVCVLDASKLVARLGHHPLAVEVIPMARRVAAREVERLTGGRAVPRAGFVTDNGNVVLDVHGAAIDDPEALEIALDAVAGVVENGLFARRPADLLLVAGEGGVIRI
jgi:ribose 5-phosphate isomerase A